MTDERGGDDDEYNSAAVQPPPPSPEKQEHDEEGHDPTVQSTSSNNDNANKVTANLNRSDSNNSSNGSRQKRQASTISTISELDPFDTKDDLFPSNFDDEYLSGISHADGQDEEDALTLSDLLGFLDEVRVPKALKQRTMQWSEKLREHRKRALERVQRASEGFRDLQNGIKLRGKAVRKMITGHEDYFVTDMLKDKSRKVGRRLITGDSNKKVRDYVREAPVVKWIDCFSFTLGVLLLVSAEFFVLKMPEHFWLFYILTVVGMLFARICLWWGGDFKYFLCDFCYYVNINICLVLILYPANATLLQICYVWANGPVGLAMVTWRNSLVFHSLEKVTSLYVHAAPALLLLCVRWYAPSDGRSPMCSDDACKLSLMNWWIYSWAGYLLWQVIQLYLTEIIGKEEIERKQLQTSCRWIATHPRMPVHSISLKVCRRFGIMGKTEKYDHTKWKTKMIFISFQAVYTLITMVHCKVLFESFWANLIYLFVLYIYCVWNGARYYIHVFAERYVLQFQAETRKVPSNNNNNNTKDSQNGQNGAALNGLLKTKVAPTDDLLAAGGEGLVESPDKEKKKA
eukprot:CAMPEP_0197523944 /NCGR_PEP_ID=MMETSP1318-20131121/8734_1 /TAXON_ID=552666 /ORGANISM="Partenskyella glossopodia, Strain RCC365" /LENGTH=571 /DNA_ID=CAMNT_0043076777 /DNA_START=251 /DNA_END=1966 /DNA_ORIENTATION=-